MDVVLPDRKTSTNNCKQFNAATYNNAHRTDILNNTILDSEKGLKRMWKNGN